MGLRGLSVLLAVVAAVLAAFVAPPGSAARTSGCPAPAGLPLQAGEIAPALRRLVPKLYGRMSNQAGRGAWRGYEVLAEFTLGTQMRITRSYRTFALHACGAGVTDRSWVAIVSFPRAQSALYGTSAAYLVRTASGIAIWRRPFVQP